MMKTCISCKQEKPAEDYRAARRMKDGRCGKCRACEAAYSRRYKATGPETRPEHREAIREFAAHVAATKNATPRWPKGE